MWKNLREQIKTGGLDGLPDTLRAMEPNELREYIKLLEYEEQAKTGLPFLYGFKHYQWSRLFFESINRTCLCTAANQIGKSFSNIRKCIDWATNREKWKVLWPKLGAKGIPGQFWYMYPSSKQALVEFHEKWKKLLPAGIYETDPVYGWKAIMRNNELFAIRFNSGVTVYFKYYSQRAETLQSSTVYAVFADEEMPEDLVDEILLRTAAVDGYFNMVFTATLGQDLWRRAMEPTDKETPAFEKAFKLQVSMYDCMEFEDGTPGEWSEEKIEFVKSQCKNSAEILRRVYGRFIKSSGLIFSGFDAKRHVAKWHEVPSSWLRYLGVDIGSGGETGHPAAITIVAVSPDFKKGRVIGGWRGDGIETSAGDIVLKVKELIEGMNITSIYYDWAAKDFETMATRNSISVLRADKNRDKGIHTVNTLFKHDMMQIYEDEETTKLVLELSMLSDDTARSKRKDDFADSFRYSISSIPWDFSDISPSKKEAKIVEIAKELTDQEKKRRGIMTEHEKQTILMEDEFEELNEDYGS